MDLFVSGEAGYGASRRGDKLLLTIPGATPPELELPRSSFRHLFPDAECIEVYNVDQNQSVSSIIQFEKDKNRSLILFLMLIDSNEPDEIRESIPNVLEDFLQHESLQENLFSAMLSYPLPNGVDLEIASGFANGKEKLSKFLNRMINAQTSVLHFWGHFQDLPDEMFERSDDRERVASLLVSSGTSSNTATHMAERLDKYAMSNAMFNAYNAIDQTEIRNGRNIVKALFQSIGSLAAQSSAAKPQSQSSNEAEKRYKTKSKATRRPNAAQNHEAFIQAKNQIQEIENQLRQLNFTKARRYMNSLKRRQVSNGGAEHAVKSLTHISKIASEIFQHEFALEAIEAALEVNSEDGRAWSQLAEVLIHQGKYEEAVKALDSAKLWGEAHFSESRRAGLMRIKGEVALAIGSYENIIREMHDAPNLFNTYYGLGDLFREEHRFEDSIKIHQQGIDKFPNEPLCIYGLARTYSSMGELDKAVKTHLQSSKKLGPTCESYTGLGHVYRDVGNQALCIKAFRSATSHFPNDSSAFRGLGFSYLKFGQTKEAHQIFDTMIERFPFDHGGFRGKAETYALEKKNESALKAFTTAVDRFPESPLLRTRKAYFLKNMGRFGDALREHSQTLQRFPNSIFAKFGQADLLKELGKYKDALSFYSKIPRLNAYLDPQVCMAAIHVTLGNFSEALALLPETDPRTRDDWIAFHIKGMALLKSGATVEAEKLFSFGVEKTPFANERAYFANALAVAALKNRRFTEVLSVLKGRDDYSSNVLQLHAYTELKMKQEAKRTLRSLQLNCPSQIIPLRNELEKRAGFIQMRPGESEEWIFGQECNMVTMGITEMEAA